MAKARHEAHELAPNQKEDGGWKSAINGSVRTFYTFTADKRNSAPSPQALLREFHSEIFGHHDDEGRLEWRQFCLVIRVPRFRRQRQKETTNEEGLGVPIQPAGTKCCGLLHPLLLKCCTLNC